MGRDTLQLRHVNFDFSVKMSECIKVKLLHLRNFIDFLCLVLSSTENIFDENFEIELYIALKFSELASFCNLSISDKRVVFSGFMDIFKD